MNPRAVLREPLTMDDYLSSRMIVPPLRVFDCDYPVNCAAAVVITTAERARDLRRPVILVDAMTWSTGPRVDWVFVDDFLYGGEFATAERLWERSSVTVDDIDVAQIYDGFTTITVSWIEALGFCGRGGFGDWVDGGKRIGPGGQLPMNTSGGQLAEGRVHAMGLLNEAVLQLRGECGERQVEGARVALVASGLYPQCGGMILTTD